MANLTVINPNTGKREIISVDIQVSMIAQQQTAEVECFVTLSSNARTVSNNRVKTYIIKSLSDGAGGEGKNRNGEVLDGDKYANITEAINDYVMLMIEGDSPENAMNINN